MNATQVLNKIMNYLALSKEEVELTYAKLKDGTIVESPTFDVGEPLEVVSEDGSKTPAPDGEHELSLRDESGNENLIKVETKDGVIVERENVELAMEPVQELPQASGDKEKADEVKDLKNQVKSGTLKMEEETEEVETIPEDDEAEMKEKKTEEVDMASMVKKFEELAYRIEEMEKKMEKMAEMPPPDEKVAEEVDMEEEELPKLDGAPVETASKFSAEQPLKVGKKIKNSQNSFLSKLYK